MKGEGSSASACVLELLVARRDTVHLQEVFHGHDPHGIELRVMTFLGLKRFCKPPTANLQTAVRHLNRMQELVQRRMLNLLNKHNFDPCS